MAVFTESDLLATWENGHGRPRVLRALDLAIAGGADPSSVADLSIGQRDAFALTLRQRCFGDRLPCAVTCPGCAEELELDLTVEDVRAGAADIGGATTVAVDGVELVVRAVTSRDLLETDIDQSDAKTTLLSRCVSGPLPEPAIDVVASALSRVDPQADVLVSLDCAACGHAWQAPFEIADYLWVEIETYAHRLLLDVHTLAGAYGWTEADVLAVSPTRRQFYLGAAAT